MWNSYLCVHIFYDTLLLHLLEGKCVGKVTQGTLWAAALFSAAAAIRKHFSARDNKEMRLIRSVDKHESVRDVNLAWNYPTGLTLFQCTREFFWLKPLDTLAVAKCLRHLNFAPPHAVQAMKTDARTEPLWHQIKLLILMARSYDQDVLRGDALLVLLSTPSA